MAVKRKKNFIAAYFMPFGLKQICDILLVTAAIVLLVGLCVQGSTFVVAFVGALLMAVGASLALFRTIRVLISDINRHSATYRNAIINTVIMGVMLALAVFVAIFVGVRYL